jgi:hypothetical protein
MGLAAGLGAAGTMVGAFGQYEGMQAQSAMAAYQAQVARYNAQLARVSATYDSAAAQNAAVAVGLRTAQERGKYIAGEGASGVDVKTGSVAQVAKGIQTTGMQNAMYVRSEGMQRAYAKQIASWQDTAQAALDQYQSSVLSDLAPLSLLGGGFKAGGQLLAGSMVGA